MKSKHWKLLFAAAVVAVASTIVPSQTNKPEIFSVRVGDQTIVIPAPEGLEEAASKSELVKAYFKASEPPNSDLLAVHIRPSDRELFDGGQRPVMIEYTKISIYRPGIERTMSAEEFAAVAAGLRKNAGTKLDPNEPRAKALLEKASKELTRLNDQSTKVDINLSEYLGTFNEGPNVFSKMALMNVRLDVGNESFVRPTLGAVSVVLVKGKLLAIGTFRLYKSQSDVEILRDFTMKWTDAILDANKQ
jgi:hypothetical protein